MKFFTVLNGNTSVENIPSQLTNLGYNRTAAVSKKRKSGYIFF